MWKSRGVGEIGKGGWEEWKTWVWFSTLSTDPAFPQLFFLLGSIRSRTVHLGPRDFASNASLAFCISCAASVSLLRMACCCNSGALIPGFKYCSHFGSETNFSYGVR